MKTKTTQTEKVEKKRNVVATRGRVFQGYVIKKFPTRIVVELERTVYVSKFERFRKDKTRLHARIPSGMDVHIGDYVKLQECRPLSKIIHFMAIEVVRKAEQ